jgi:WD40 repeat protein/energy-coupling factor transporter ATP-binding protein EcfA2
MPSLSRSDVPNRRILVIGSTRYQHHGDLLRVEEELDTVTVALALGASDSIDRVTDPDRRMLLESTVEVSQGCATDDLMILYYSGHGARHDRFYLLTNEAGQSPTSWFRTAVGVDDLVRALTLECKAAQILLIVDVCFAGAAAAEILQTVGEITEVLRGLVPVFVICASRPREEADQGALSAALSFALGNHGERFGGRNQRYLAIDEVMEAVSQYLKNYHPRQTAQWSTTNAEGRSQFFRNPHYRPELSPGLDLATQQAFVEHWLPKAKGADHASTGWYFTGRSEAVNDVATWLNRQQNQDAALIITGGPGSGKSALLGHIIALAEPEYHDAAAATGTASSSTIVLPELGVIDIAIHARHKLLADLVNDLSRSLGLLKADLTDVLDTVRKRPTKIVIVVDALDEADEVDTIVQRLLLPLTGHKNVFLIVGTRPDWVGTNPRFRALGNTCIEIDLDHPKYKDDDSVARYVERRLLAEEEPRKYTPYRNLSEIARRVALAVAARADNVFLVAHTAALALLAQPDPVDTRIPGWVETLPTGLDQAFNQYLSRLDSSSDHGVNAQSARDVLRALAFAQGEGLPWADLWASAATALAGRNITDKDIEYARAHVAPFIVESREDGRSVYRLYHEAVAQYLRRTVSDQNNARQQLFDALLARVPHHADGGKDWIHAHPYLKRHLSSFAADAGCLDVLTEQPHFLLAAEPHILSRQMRIQSGCPTPTDKLYLKKYGALRLLDYEARYRYLALEFAKEGMQQMLQPLVSRIRQDEWLPSWASWKPSDESNLFTGVSPITALNTATSPSIGTVVLIGLEDGTINIVHLEEGRVLDQWSPCGIDAVTHLALVDNPQGELLVAGFISGHVAVRNILTRQEYFQKADTQGISDLIQVQRDGGTACLIARDDRSLTLYTLPDLRLIKRRNDASPAHIYALAQVPSSSGNKIVVGSDTFHDGQQCAKKLSMWTLDLEPVWKSSGAIERLVYDIEVFHHMNNAYIATRDFVHSGEIWRVDDNKLTNIYSGFANCEDLRFYSTGDDTILYVRNQNNLFTTPVDLDESCPSLSHGPMPFRRVKKINGKRWSPIVEVYGQPCVVTASVAQVKLWNLAENADEAETEDGVFASEFRSLFVEDGGDGVIYCGTRDSKIVAFDGKTGSTLWVHQLSEHFRPVTSLTGYRDESAFTLLAACNNGIHVLDIVCGPAGERFIQTGDEILRLACCITQGRPQAFATVREEGAWSLRVWDITTQMEIEHRRPSGRHSFRLTSGQEDKPLTALAAHSRAEAIKVVFASRYAQVMAMAYPPTNQNPWADDFETWRVGPNDNSVITSLAYDKEGTHLAVGTSQSSIIVRNANTGEHLATSVKCHLERSPINALVFSQDGTGNLLVISGGDDGFIRSWSSDLTPRSQFFLGSAVVSINADQSGRLVVATHDGVVAMSGVF